MKKYRVLQKVIKKFSEFLQFPTSYMEIGVMLSK